MNVAENDDCVCEGGKTGEAAGTADVPSGLGGVNVADREDGAGQGVGDEAVEAVDDKATRVFELSFTGNGRLAV